MLHLFYHGLSIGVSPFLFNFQVFVLESAVLAAAASLAIFRVSTLSASSAAASIPKSIVCRFLLADQSIGGQSMLLNKWTFLTFTGTITSSFTGHQY